jgi:hypothetical protein
MRMSRQGVRTMYSLASAQANSARRQEYWRPIVDGACLSFQLSTKLCTSAFVIEPTARLPSVGSRCLLMIP